MVDMFKPIKAQIDMKEYDRVKPVNSIAQPLKDTKNQIPVVNESFAIDPYGASFTPNAEENPRVRKVLSSVDTRSTEWDDLDGPTREEREKQVVEWMKDYQIATRIRSEYGKTDRGKEIALAEGVDTIFYLLPEKGMPSEYYANGVLKSPGGKYYNVWGAEVTPPPENYSAISQAPDSTFLESLLGEYAAHTPTYLKKLFTGDEADKKEALEGLIADYAPMGSEMQDVSPLQKGERSLLNPIRSLSGIAHDITGGNPNDEEFYKTNMQRVPKIGITGWMNWQKLAQTATGTLPSKIPTAMTESRAALTSEMKNLVNPGITSVDPLFKAAGVGIKATASGIKDLINLPPRLAYKSLKLIMPEMKSKSFRELAEVPGRAVWENFVVKPFTWKAIPTPSGVQKSLAEIWQPGVDRLQKIGATVEGKASSLAGAIRKPRAQAGLTTQAGISLGKKVSQMGVKERYEAAAALRGIKLLGNRYKGVGSSIISTVKDTLKEADASDTYTKAFAKNLKKYMLKTTGKGAKATTPLGQEQFVVYGSDVLNTLDDFVTNQKAVSPKQVQHSLKKAIMDPLMDEDTRHLARELYNLPYNTPYAVAQASRDAAKASMVRNLHETGMVRASLEGLSPAEQKNWLMSQSKNSDLKGLYIMRDAELDLRSMDVLQKLASQNFQKWFMTPWKTNKVILRPASHFRNAISNLIQNDMGGLSVFNIGRYYQAAEDMLKGGKYTKLWNKTTGGSGTFASSDLSQIAGGLKFPSNMLDHMLAVYDRVAEVPRSLYQSEEQFFKIAHFIHRMEKYGDTPEQAAASAMKYLFNYNEITGATAYAKSYFAPFVTWQTKVIPMFAETTVKHPLRVGKWWAFYEALQQNSIQATGMSNDEWDYVHSILPEYVRDSAFLLLPWRDDKDRLQMLNLTYMIPGFGDLAELQSGGVSWALSSPMYELGGALKNNTRYGGAPIWYDWDIPQTKFAKAMGYVWQQWSPSYAPGGVDWNTTWQMARGEQDALTGGQALGLATGFKIKPVDIAQQIKQNQTLQKIKMQQLGSSFNKQMRSVVSKEEAEEYIRRKAQAERRIKNIVD